jgi:hypothetical protein
MDFLLKKVALVSIWPVYPGKGVSARLCQKRDTAVKICDETKRVAFLT